MTPTRRFRSAVHAVVLAAFPCLLAACGEAESAPAPVQTIEIAGLDYAFEAPAEIDPGWTTFRFTNRGPEPHHLTLFRLAPGRTVGELITAFREMKPTAEIATALGGPNAPMPGQSSVATLRLEPGEYALACVIPSPDGVLHLFKGMVKPITVRPGEAEGVEPAADLAIILDDYSFRMEGTAVAGERSFRVTNASDASEPHEVVLVRLAPGRTAEDVNHWMHAMDGPPPGEFLGGITALDPGQSGIFTATLTPGEYALLCPIPSPDGHPHTNKGMIQPFSVS